MTFDSLQLPSRALIAGHGDIGQRVAALLHARGCAVTALVRSVARLLPDAARAASITQHDLDTPYSVGDWPLLFWFAPPPGSGARDTRLRNWLAAQHGRINRLVYISTSGVYGDCQGRWIDEDEPLVPRSERGIRRVDAEAALQQWQADTGNTVVILRVPGIYGPGRLPIERLRQGLPVLMPAQSPYTNRIHADDLAQAALHAAALGRAGDAYHVSDGQPTTMADYFQRCAALLQLPLPREVDLAEAQRVFTPAMWSFMEESKRLKTERLREQLQFTPRYADLAAGLPSCLPPLIEASHKESAS